MNRRNFLKLIAAAAVCPKVLLKNIPTPKLSPLFFITWKGMRLYYTDKLETDPIIYIPEIGT